MPIIKAVPVFLFVIFSLTFSACQSAQAVETAASNPQSSSAPGTFLPTEAQATAEAFTPAPFEVPNAQPASIGGSNGAVIYDDGNNVLNVNLDRGEMKILISRDELRILLPEDKSAYSITFAYEKPVDIELSPDLTRALITTCSSLDERYQCIFNYFTYILETKAVARIPTPPDIHGVHWKWSPDGTKLAGAAWTFSGTDYEVTRVYSSKSDGSDFRALIPVRNKYWHTEWHPGSSVILPLTLVSDFRSIFTDDPKELGISIKGLRRNDKIECLSFSPDTMKVAFIIRRERPSREQPYVARSDFADLAPMPEYIIDPNYTCSIAWSPDQNFLHVGYEYASDQEDGQVTTSDIPPLPGKVMQPGTGNIVELPNDIHFCSWSSNGRFIYERLGLPDPQSEMGIFSVSDLSQTSLPGNIQAIVNHCPMRWLEQDLSINIPVGLKVPNACHPGDFRVDDEDPVYPSVPSQFNMLEVSSSLTGEELRAVVKFNMVSNDLTSYLTPGITDFMNGWDILVDIDDNVATGDRFGSEYRLSVVIRPGSNEVPPALGSAILKYDPVTKTYSKAGSLGVSLDPDTQELTLTGVIPEISQATRLVFLSRMFDTATNSLIGDRICN